MTDCALKCPIPDSFREVPKPRGNWSDVFSCSNEGCEKAFMIGGTPFPYITNTFADLISYFGSEMELSREEFETFWRSLKLKERQYYREVDLGKNGE